MNDTKHQKFNTQNGHDSHQHSKWTRMLKLMYPGMRIKRWLLTGTVGVSICSVGLAFLLRKLLLDRPTDYLPTYLEGFIIIVVGLTIMILALYGLYRSLFPLLFASTTIDSIANTIYTRRSRRRGPKIVAIGGGTGLSVLLRGLKEYTDNLTAIITVADDGGSSGRLRRDMGVLPPGDFRNCLVAMSDAESLLTDLFQYRFDQDSELKGHSFGNLFIAAMTDVTQSFERALYESSRVLAVRGQIIPSTEGNIKLSARLKSGEIVDGESTIASAGDNIDEVFITPSDVDAYPFAIEAIREAQLIVIGPGSLYTSIIPNLLLKEVAEALRDSMGIKIYVCNVATEQGETNDYTVSDHLEALQKHTYSKIVDFVVANNAWVELSSEYDGQQVLNNKDTLRYAELRQSDLVDVDHPLRHDAEKLAKIITDVYDEVHSTRK